MNAGKSQHYVLSGMINFIDVIAARLHLSQSLRLANLCNKAQFTKRAIVQLISTLHLVLY